MKFNLMQHHLELNPLCPFSCLFFTVLIFCRIFCMFCIFVFILHVETSFWRLLVDIIVQVMLCNFDQAAICAVSESSGNIHVYWFCRMLSTWFSQVSPVAQRNCLLRKIFLSLQNVSHMLVISVLVNGQSYMCVLRLQTVTYKFSKA